jgi:CRISPR-associated protein (TIGR02710 family)
LIVAKTRELQQEASGNQIYADYTGGTKTMSLALGMVAFDSNIPLFLTTSATRENLIKVERGESTERAPTTLVTVERTLNQILPSFLVKYDYPAAIAQLQNLLQSLELPSDQKRRIRELRDCCASLDAWDRFDHTHAWLLLEPQMKQLQQLGLFLKRVMYSRSIIDPAFKTDKDKVIPGHGYEIVEDLLLNAKRRAAQERYDDAVGRIYRALELLVQLRLKQAYELQTGDIDIEKLSENLRETYEGKRSPHNGKIQLALRDSYELLTQLKNDALGILYQESKNRIIDALVIRNNSLFAHGFKPISNDDYRKVSEVIVSFIEAGITAVASSKSPKVQSVQFPTNLSF